ncbi:hypothetical protein F9C07_2134255 [Aspergillus flavus]|uniref:Uncharacterized protein n=1 Tax=Aspergillus flavus (strain ATCC 200026 / FGSC A1120 / IAM 13836 / NRRL 3357 / JCM 12722 / SRRC 167) TaxID=332952 RepID=A0A7U2MNN9_ASPFN|nr:hypothetical protein F9C07_2134255 [Aspergillus flavus]
MAGFSIPAIQQSGNYYFSLFSFYFLLLFAFSFTLLFRQMKTPGGALPIYVPIFHSYSLAQITFYIIPTSGITMSGVNRGNKST